MFIERYDNGISGNHLILESDILNDVGYKSRMLVENNIPNFLTCSVIRSDGKDQYVYDITSLISLYDLYECDEMDHRFLCCLINGMAGGLEDAAEFLLKPEHLIFDPRHIYVDRERWKILWCYYPGSYTMLSEGMNELSEYILKKADHKDDAAVSLAYGLYKQVVNEDYTLRRLVSESNPMTFSVNEDNEEDGDFKVTDDREFMTLSSDDAPQLPLSGKIITGVCILCLLFISTFTFVVSLYGGDSWTSLMAMTEMRILLSLSGAMAILLPTLILLKWYNRFRLFKQTLEEADGHMDDICMRMYGDKNVHFGWEL